jgi:hypothetical protein
MLLMTILAFGVAAGGSAACLHGRDETAEQAKRREDALRAVRYINTAENMGLERAKRYVPLSQVPGVPAAPGFKLSLVADNKSYMLAARDTRDTCGFAYFTDETGLVYEAQPIPRSNARGGAHP